MYVHNKTRLWLASLKKKGEKTHYGNYEGGKDRRKLIRSRLAEIQKQRVELQKQKRQRLQESERKHLRNDENMTNLVCYYGICQNANQIE
jgi:50S ribosomal subunit-associated GTPase HflX